jgi:hypothetical protein
MNESNISFQFIVVQAALCYGLTGRYFKKRRTTFTQDTLEEDPIKSIIYDVGEKVNI